ncbi:MAG: hypothetical protein R2706_20730 [Acidimicrobiales bacterium]
MSELTGRRCIFCEAAGPLTREHVIPLWLTEIISDQEPETPDWRIHYSSGGLVERDRQYSVPDPTVIVRAVCGSCNTGWMSELEQRVQPLIGPMVGGHRTTLDPRQQLEVATWASKTMMALEFHEPGTSVTTPADRTLMRSELRPPHHHRVRLAYRDAYSESLVAKMLVAGTENAKDSQPDCFALLLAIGFLVVQVWGGHGTSTEVEPDFVGTERRRTLSVLPPVPRTVSWPPSVSVSDEDLDALAREPISWADDSPELATWREMRRPDDWDDSEP